MAELVNEVRIEERLKIKIGKYTYFPNVSLFYWMVFYLLYFWGNATVIEINISYPVNITPFIGISASTISFYHS